VHRKPHGCTSRSHFRKGIVAHLVSAIFSSAWRYLGYQLSCRSFGPHHRAQPGSLTQAPKSSASISSRISQESRNGNNNTLTRLLRRDRPQCKLLRAPSYLNYQLSKSHAAEQSTSHDNLPIVPTLNTDLCTNSHTPPILPTSQLDPRHLRIALTSQHRRRDRLVRRPGPVARRRRSPSGIRLRNQYRHALRRRSRHARTTVEQ
jgi:hypothetical protein